MTRTTYKNSIRAALYYCALIGICYPAVAADKPVFEIQIKDHLFIPSVIEIPADTKVKLLVINNDATPEEFESYELNREKVIVGNQKATIFIGPLKPGEYPFFGEFHPKTAVGKIVVVE